MLFECSIFLFACRKGNGFYHNIHQNMKKIKIYNDNGVSKECIEQTVSSLKRYIPEGFLIELMSANDILQGNELDQTHLFILPGGADLFYLEKLKGEGDRKIQQFIRNGGNFLGICAGSYYSGNYCEFAKGTNIEVCGVRELALFPGTVRGPTLAPYTYNSTKGARGAHLSIKGESIDDCYVYYNGGGSFLNAKEMEGVHVLAEYENLEAAIIKLKYGGGTVVLSGVHFEYDPSMLKEQLPDNSLERLVENDPKRVQLFKNLLDMLSVR